MTFDDLSKAQQWALVQLTHGDFGRTRAGWHRPDSINTASSQTMMALARRGLCKLDIAGGKASLTARARKLLAAECAAVNAAIARSETGPAETPKRAEA